MMRAFSFDNILLICKKSMYQLYFLDREPENGEHQFNAEDMARLEQAHTAHLETLAAVEKALAARNLRYREVCRGQPVDCRGYDFVIAVGGDGTLIEASRGLEDQPLLGVNSDPERSWGHFCCTDKAGFPRLLDELLAAKARFLRLTRLKLRLDGELLAVTGMNEVLVSHQRPAAMSLYHLRVGEIEETQRGSGLWISTAAGSTGAILSAGGRIMRPRSRRLQYLPRELFRGDDQHYRLKGGIVAPDQSVRVQSRMREGMISLDGSHYRLPFGFGHRLEVTRAARPLRLVVTGNEGIGKVK